MCPLNQELFWNKVLFTNDCWEWIGAKVSGGYGSFNIDKRSISAHRVAYQLQKGEIPNGMDLDHLCRNRICVNPHHLEPVTRSVNCRRGDTGRITGMKERMKTHCPKGHEYNHDNTYLSPKGCRYCKTCHGYRMKVT